MEGEGKGEEGGHLRGSMKRRRRIQAPADMEKEEGGEGEEEEEVEGARSRSSTPAGGGVVLPDYLDRNHLPSWALTPPEEDLTPALVDEVGLCEADDDGGGGSDGYGGGGGSLK